MIFNMIINEIAKSMNLDNDVALYIVYILSTCFAIYYFEQKTSFHPLTNFIQLFQTSLNRLNCSFCKRVRGQTIYQRIQPSFGHTPKGAYFHVYQQTYLEKFLYEKPEHFQSFPKVSWTIQRLETNFSFDKNGDAVVTLKNGTNTLPILKEGIYNVSLSPTLSFEINIYIDSVESFYKSQNDASLDFSAKTPIDFRVIQLTFFNGTFETLRTFIHSQLEHFVLESRWLREDENYRISKGFGPKYDMNIWRGYYHPRLDQIISWTKMVDSPNPDDKFTLFNQPRQMSILCYGKPGTGKSSLVYKVAEFTQRHIVSVNLLSLTSIYSITQVFRTPHVNGEYVHPKQVIFLLDEFDKVIKKMTLITQKKLQDKENLMRVLASSVHGFPMMQSSVIPSYVDSSAATASSSSAAAAASTSSKSSSSAAADTSEVETSVIPVKGKGGKTKEEMMKMVNAEIDEFEWTIDDLLTILCGSIIPTGRIIIATANDIETIRTYCPPLVRSGRMTPIEFTNGDAELFCRIVKDYTDITIEPSELPDDFQFMHSALIEYLVSNLSISKEQILSNLRIFGI
jgi:hypothetical protein